MARIGEGQEIPSNEFKKAIYAIRGNNRQTKGVACAVAIEGQNEGSVLLVTDTWKGPKTNTGCRLHRYSRIAQHFKDYQLKPVSISQRGDFSLVMCDRKDSSFEIKSLHKKCLSGQELERHFRVYTIYRDKCIDLELKYNNGGYNLIDNDLPDLTLCGSPIIDGDNFEKCLVGILTTNDEGKAIPCFLSNGVLEQPAFTTNPKDPQTRREGENITFSSDANGIPEPTFTWTRNESAVTDNDRISLLAAKKQLSITNVNRTDSGKYRCVATNSFGTVYSDAATLTVHYQPEFTEHPESRTKREGSSVDFLSDAHGVPEPKFSWIKDGTALAESNRISFLRDKKQLRITGVEKEDGGKYQCVASNKVNDRVTSDPATLKVEDERWHLKACFLMAGNYLIDGVKQVQPIVLTVLSAVFLYERMNRNIWTVEPCNSILVELHCYTTANFLSLVEDFEKGIVKRRLEEEFEKVGCKGELELTITNEEEVYEALDEIRAQMRKRAVELPAVTDDPKKQDVSSLTVLPEGEDTEGEIPAEDRGKEDVASLTPSTAAPAEVKEDLEQMRKGIEELIDKSSISKTEEEQNEDPRKPDVAFTTASFEGEQTMRKDVECEIPAAAVANDGGIKVVAAPTPSSEVEDTEMHKDVGGEILAGAAAPEYSPEQLNYLRMCLIVFDVVAKGLRIIFKREWDIRFNKTLGKWMDKPTNGRDFCSMESPRNQQMRARLLATMINGNTEEWDLLMLFYAILYSESLGRGISAEVRSAVDDLRNLRNELAHSAQARVSDSDFFSLFNRVIRAFQSLGLSPLPLRGVVEEDLAECSTEQLNYFKMCYLVSDVVTKGLRMLFKREWDFRYEKTLGEWTDKPKNGRDFYSMELPRSRKTRAHVLATMTNGNTEEWDITMLCYAIMYSDSIGSSLSPAVRSQVDVLRNVRNETMNSSRASLSVADLQDIVQKVHFAFRCLGLSTQLVQDLEKQTFQFEPTEGSYDEKQQLEKQVEDLEFEEQKDVSSFCRLPLKPPLDIIGRESDKEKIVQELQKLKKNNEVGLSCLIISGRPGSGKSQLARQVAESFYYDATKITDVHAFVMTLNAESSDSLLESFTSFAKQMKCSEIEVNKVLVSEDETSDEKIIRLKNLIQERIHLYATWLLVIDNVTGVRNILMSLPGAGNALWKTGQMLITTRDTVAELPEDTFTSHISINQGMEPNDAVSLMVSVSGTGDKEMIAKVAKELDFQPLALVNAATCVKHDCQSNEDPNLAWTEILNALKADKEQSVFADVSTPESSIVKSTDVVIRLAVEEHIKNDVIKLVFTFLSLFKRKVFDLHALITYVQNVLEERQDKEEIRKKSESQIKACPLLLLEEEANNVKIGVHQVVFNSIKSTLKKRSIPDSQIRAAVKLSYQMEIDPFEESSDMLELVDDERFIPFFKLLICN